MEDNSLIAAKRRKKWANFRPTQEINGRQHVQKQLTEDCFVVAITVEKLDTPRPNKESLDLCFCYVRHIQESESMKCMKRREVSCLHTVLNNSVYICVY